MDTAKQRGSNIQLKLVERKGKGFPYTQRWLLNELRKSDFPYLTEYKLSNILNGHYITGYASEVLSAAEKILSKEN